MSSLKSWRELLSMPLSDAPKGDTEKIPEGIASANHANPQTPDSLRVDLFTEEYANPTQNPARPRLVYLGESRWAEAEWARELCVMCPEPLAPGDLVTCVEHQGRLPGLAGQKCLIAGCLVPTVDIAYCGQHRRMADLGTLWPNDGRGCDA